VFHVAASETPHGKNAAYDLMSKVSRYTMQTMLTFVPALKIAPRAPLGPSEVLKAGIPFEGIAVDLQ
jgi:hypothetical protein